MEKLSRRNLLKRAGIVGGIAAVSGKALADACGNLTPAQTEGPFYPIQDQADKDTDLTTVKGKTEMARGEIVYLKGTVVDENCRPVKGALVEIWQACDTGKYNHPSDPNSAELDPNFQYWGRMVTNEMGEYQFKTIKPGAYPATNTWMRPPHIHFKVHLRGYEEITSQLYWKGHPLNVNDRILQSLSQADRDKVLVDFKNVDGKVVGDLTITIKAY